MVIRIDKDGTVVFIQNDEIDMRIFGKPKMKRASHVEWDEKTDGWMVDLTPVGGPIVSGFGDSRACAVRYERKWIEENVLSNQEMSE